MSCLSWFRLSGVFLRGVGVFFPNSVSAVPAPGAGAGEPQRGQNTARDKKNTPENPDAAYLVTLHRCPSGPISEVARRYRQIKLSGAPRSRRQVPNAAWVGRIKSRSNREARPYGQAAVRDNAAHRTGVTCGMADAAPDTRCHDVSLLVQSFKHNMASFHHAHCTVGHVRTS